MRPVLEPLSLVALDMSGPVRKRTAGASVRPMDRDEPYDDANYAPSASASASQPRDALVTGWRADEANLELGRSIN